MGAGVAPEVRQIQHDYTTPTRWLRAMTKGRPKADTTTVARINIATSKALLLDDPDPLSAYRLAIVMGMGARR